jgi:hypothetical protein
MVATVLYSVVKNTTGAVLTGSGDASSADIGDQMALQPLKRIFYAIDVGTDAGKTRDNTDPTRGCLLCKIHGSRVYGVVDLGLYRTTAATNRDFKHKVTGTGANTVNIGFRVFYDTKSGTSYIYAIDSAADAPGQIVADDELMYAVLVGSSAFIEPFVA